MDVRRGWVLGMVGLVMAGVAGCSGGSSRPAATAATAGGGPIAETADPAQLAAARNNLLTVLDDYERDGAAVKTGVPKKDYGDDLSKYFSSTAAMTAIHGGGGIGAPIGCGKAAGHTVVDGAIVGAPVEVGGAVALPVSLYTGTEAVARLTVSVDAAGKLSALTCQGPGTVDPPGAGVLVAYYGGLAALAVDPAADDKVQALKARYVAPAFAAFVRADVEADQTDCAEDELTYWHAVYDPSATGTGAQWYFNPGGGPGQVNMSVAVDAAGSRVAWVYCFGQLVAAPAAGGAYSDSQVQSFIGDLFNDYAYLRALTPFGADASGMKGYFGSDAAYQSAMKGTGAQPLECSGTAATSIGADDVNVTGGTAVVSLTASSSADPAKGTVLGRLKVTVDVGSMKITGVACA